MSLFEALSPARPVIALASAWWTESKKAMADLMMIQAVSDEAGTFAAWDGSLVSLVDLAGSAGLVGPQEHARQIDLLGERLGGLFARKGHALHLVWENDPDGGAAELDDVLDRLRAGAARYQLDLDDLIAERGRAVAARIGRETITLALWTRPGALDPAQYRHWKKTYAARAALLPDPDRAQNPFTAGADLVTLHDAFVSGLIAALGETGVAATCLPAAAALDRMALHLGPLTFGGPGQPRDTGPQARARMRDPGPPDGAINSAALLGLPLAEQLLAFEPDTARETVCFAGRRYAPLDVALGPVRIAPWDELTSRLRQTRVPVRLSLLFESDGLPALLALKNLLAGALSLTNGENMLRLDALRDLTAAREAGRAIVRFRASVLTWTDDPDPGALARAKSRLTQLIQGWGDMVLSRAIGDPLESFTASVPGLVCAATGPAGAMTLPDMLRFLPLGRARHIDPDGTLSLRTPDGRHVRHAPRSAGFNCDLISGLPGRGKSVLIAALSLSSLLGSRSADLPFDATIDVGGSIAGYIATLRAALPADQRHLAGFFALENTPSHAINIHDTRLGYRFPLPHEKAFLAAFYLRLLTPEDGRAIDGLADLVEALITAVYDLRAGLKPGADPALYVPGTVRAVDDVLERRQMAVTAHRTSWWEITDALFEHGQYREATLAQRQAVPTLRDVASALHDPRIAARAARIGYSPTETLRDAILRLIGAALARWPILAGPTALDLSEMRIIGIDVGAVAPQEDSPAARKQTALIYMLARTLAVRDWWIPESAIAALPAGPVRAYHAPRIERLLETPKTVKYDEAHRASGLWDAILLDIRETRKKNFHVLLGSQLPTDFPQAVRTLANRHWLMSAGVRAAETREIVNLYGFGPELARRARTGLHKPDARGAPFLTLMATPEGFYAHHLYLSLGAMELWAWSTEPKDAVFRRRLEQKVGPRAARLLLARSYPDASILEPLRTRIRAHEMAGRIDQASEAAVMDEMIAEICTAIPDDPTGTSAARPFEDGESHALD